jgi:hypothetical protein
MIAILFSLLLFQFGLAEWPACPPPISESVYCYYYQGYCTMVNNVTSSSPTYFDDWDFALSSVVRGPANISIEPNITIPNLWTIPPGDFCYGPEVYTPGINVNLNANVTETWNVWDNGTTYEVPEGQYGVLVINPWTMAFSGTTEGIIDPNCNNYYCDWEPPFMLNSWQVYLRQVDPSIAPGTFVGGTISLLLSCETPIPCRFGPCSHS